MNRVRLAGCVFIVLGMAVWSASFTASGALGYLLAMGGGGIAGYGISRFASA